jgi:hypothetical protein
MHNVDHTVATWLARLGGGLAGLAAGLLLWALILGIQLRPHEPGLWTLRAQRVISCGLDYNGPPYTSNVKVWLACSEDSGWLIWPP